MAIELLQEFDTSNWPSVLQAHRGWLSSVVYARVRDNDAVEEVLQETALAASKQLNMANDQEGIFRWLYRVAIRQAMLYRRKQFRSDKRVRDLGDQQSIHAAQQTHKNNPLHLLIASEDREQVRMALSRLDAKDCEILMLKYCDEWSCRDVGERLGVSESAIKSRLLRARRNLRNELVRINQNWEIK